MAPERWARLLLVQREPRAIIVVTDWGWIEFGTIVRSTALVGALVGIMFWAVAAASINRASATVQSPPRAE